MTPGGDLFQFQMDQWVLNGYQSKELPQAVQNFGITDLESTGLVCNIQVSHLTKHQFSEVLVDNEAVENLRKGKNDLTATRIVALFFWIVRLPPLI